MKTEIDYNGPIEVIKPLVEDKVNQLISSAIPLPPGVVVIKPTTNWIGNTLFFSFTITAAVIIRTKVKGSAKIEDGKIVIASDIPKIILKDIDEDTISKSIITYVKNQIIAKIT